MRHYLGPHVRRSRAPATRSPAAGATPSLAAKIRPDDALTLAVQLYRSPGLLRSIRRSPVPPGILPVIRIAAGCPTSGAAAVARTGLDEASLVRIATLYLLVVLFEQENDPHRTLGVLPGASAEVIQDHKKWLLKWLHPDRNANQNLAALSVRVLAASAALAEGLRAVPALPSDAQPSPAAAAVEIPEPKRKHKVRHVWVPQRVGG